MRNNFLLILTAANTGISKVLEWFGQITLADWASIMAIVSGVFYCAQVIHNWNKEKE